MARTVVLFYDLLHFGISCFDNFLDSHFMVKWTVIDISSLGKQCRPRSDSSLIKVESLPFRLHLLDQVLCSKTIMFQF